MDNNSLQDFLKTMAVKPQTWNWDAMLVFDRSKTNVLLLQEFIDRFGTGDYFPAIERSEIAVGEGLKHALEGLVLGKPLLSFENASLAESKAKLTLRIEGGKQIQLSEVIRDGRAVKTATRLASFNALAGPSLLMDINLQAVPGTVDGNGHVLLDLSEGVNHYFTGVETDFEAEKLATHFKDILKTWNTALTAFPLSELAQSDESLLQPAGFGVRTHAAPGAKVRGASNYGDGAVVVFVAMRGSGNGGYPPTNGDLLYMLPEAEPAYSSNLILGHKFLMTKVLLPALNEVDWVRSAKLQEREITGSPRRELVATEGAHTVPGKTWEVGTYKMEVPGQVFPFAAATVPLRLRVVEDKLLLEWKTDLITSDVVFDYINPDPNFPGRVRKNGKIGGRIEMSASFKWVAKDVGGKQVVALELFESENLSLVQVTDHPSNWGQNTRDLYNRMLSEINVNLRALVEPLIEQVKAISAVLDAFRLNNLLFRGDNIVTPRDLHWPTDLTMLGDLAPDRTQLEVTPKEAVVPAGQTLKFTCTPEGAVKWKVENLPGESGAKGEIHETTGLYTAPPSASLRDDGARRVIVSATRDNLTSKALVSLIEHEVSVYPMVLIASLGSKNSLAAASAGGAGLKWSLGGDELGSIIVDPDGDPLVQDGREYHAPTALPEPGANDPLNYWAARLVQVQVTPEAGGTTRSVDVLVVGAQGNFWFEPEAVSGGGVRLRFYKATKKAPRVEVPADEADWHVYKGDGTLADGVYTPKSGSSEQYAIITAYIDDDEVSDKYAYMIVPVPFVSAQRFCELLNISQV